MFPIKKKEKNDRGIEEEVRKGKELGGKKQGGYKETV